MLSRTGARNLVVTGKIFRQRSRSGTFPRRSDPTMNLNVGRTVIFLATRDPQSQRALVVILTAKR